MQMPVFLLPPSAFKVLFFLFAHEEKGKVVASVTDIAVRVSMTRKTTREAIQHLESLKLLKVVPGTALDPAEFFIARSLKSATGEFKILRDMTVDVREPGGESGQKVSGESGQKVSREKTVHEGSATPRKDEEEGGSGQKVSTPFFSTPSTDSSEKSGGSMGKVGTVKEQRGQKMSGQKVSAHRKAASLLAPDEEILLLRDASKILGVTVGISHDSDFGRRVRTVARARIREGYTKENLLDACKYAAKNWSNGARFSGFKNLLKVWSSLFQELLATKGEAGTTRSGGAVFGSKERWAEDTKRKLRERGEKW